MSYCFQRICYIMGKEELYGEKQSETGTFYKTIRI